MWRQVLCGMTAMAVLVACSTSEGFEDLESSAYEGLPGEVVQERLADPVLTEALIDGFSPEDRTSVVQLNVSYAIFCRALFKEYEDWTLLGDAPEVPEVVVPDEPSEMFDLEAEIWTEAAATAIVSNDPSQLRRELLLYGGCRDFVLDPNADSQKTVADALGD